MKAIQVLAALAMVSAAAPFTAAVPAHFGGWCAAPPPAAAPGPAKPSALAPRGQTRGRAYGAPIQPPIFHSRTRHKRQPAQAPAR
jgi:hypothetical protein